jgi:hypothetical protein
MATAKKAVKKKAVKKKSAATKASPKKAAAKKAPSKKAAAKTTTLQDKIKVTRDQHHKMICEAAYYISLERTQETVNPTEDWLKAEAAINQIYVIND